MQNREKFGSRLGFILVSAGCAVGLGNVWKFPYMCGQYGGAAFILIYLVFLAILGFPIMVCEFSVGRGSQKSCATSFRVLEPEGSKWHNFGYFGMAGNYLLMMFYTMVAGWMMYYCYRCLTGEFTGTALTTDQVGEKFNAMLSSPGTLTFWMVIAVVLAFGICSLGVQKGVEKITKIMMLCLLCLIVVLAGHSVTLPGAGEGVKFYLVPDFAQMKEKGIGNVIFGAMSKAFFTLSIGIGSMAIFGSYLKKDKTLLGEAVNVAVLDTFVAIVAGLIIFPACFSFGVNPDSGPSLIFITLPNVFLSMTGGRIWGALFFIFMAFASLSTVIAVFENIIACTMELWNITRKKSVIINLILITVFSLPCALGFNVLDFLQPLGSGSTILDLEDFIVSNLLLPLGSLVYLLFCTSRLGWGFKNYQTEANMGDGPKIHNWMQGYLTIILPIAVIFVFISSLM